MKFFYGKGLNPKKYNVRWYQKIEDVSLSDPPKEFVSRLVTYCEITDGEKFWIGKTILNPNDRITKVADQIRPLKKSLDQALRQLMPDDPASRGEVWGIFLATKKFNLEIIL